MLHVIVMGVFFYIGLCSRLSENCWRLI